MKMKCRICYSENLTKFLDLGHQPLADAFLTEEQLGELEIHYPLDVWMCGECGLAQLGYVVSRETLYQDAYPYLTGQNKEGIRHFRQLAEDVVEQYGLGFDDLVVDIGSNDGTLLKGFQDAGCEVQGFEPSKAIAYIASKNGIQTAVRYFDEYGANRVVEAIGKAKVITATNVFAHVDDLHEFMRAVDILLADDGVFIIEAPSFYNLIDNFAYDTIYHEHLSYLSYYPLFIWLEKEFGMYITKSQEYKIHGGTIRYYIQKSDVVFNYDIAKGITELSKYGLPGKKWLCDNNKIACFAQEVDLNRAKLIQMLHEIKRKSKRIVGVSAPAKGNTLLNYCKIGPDILDYITEKNSLKIGKYTPGMHIEIVPDERLVSDQPDYALVLAWNFKDSIMHSLREIGYEGRFIVPIPEPKVYDKFNWHQIDGL